ncbi:MAG TPA: hypothetical protein VMB21_03880 [Candidatus Limnocylindria bacterium]|jgi:hypothetical protein|nr:hypothetical protein [Candidatus Limnocylindria bacterium]
MFRPLVVFAAGLCLIASVRAQINVKLSTGQEQFLPGEELDLAVKVSNFTGAPLRLGTFPRWIAFTVERSEGGVVNKLTEVADTGEFTLQQATGGTLHFDLAPLFALDRPGSYRVTAVITPVNDGPNFVSPPLTFEIVNGVTLNEDQSFGFTRPDGTTEQRRYLLQQANFLKHLRLYLRITDAPGTHTFKVVPLGSLVTFNPPQWVFDRQSHLHVLHQFGATECRYQQFDPDGKLITRQTWLVTNRRPQLRVNESGEAAVVGGARRSDRTDFPAPTEAELAAAQEARLQRAQQAASASTNAVPKDKKKQKN